MDNKILQPTTMVVFQVLMMKTYKKLIYSKKPIRKIGENFKNEGPLDFKAFIILRYIFQKVIQGFLRN